MAANNSSSLDMLDVNFNTTMDEDPTGITGYLILYVTLMGIVSCIGVPGNILILVAVLTNKNLRRLSNVLIVNLAVADLLITSINVPFAIVGALHPNVLFKFPSLCTAIGAISVTTCGCSIWTIMSISLDRYLHICHPNFPSLLTRRTVPVIMACPWLIGFALDLPNFLTWGSHGYELSSRRCTYETNTYAYNIYLYVVGAVIPTLIVPYCYLRIYLSVRRSNRSLQSAKHGGAQNQDVRLLKTVFTIWVLFTLMWNPHGVYILLGEFYIWPYWLVMISVALAYTNSCINCIIYGIVHKNFRQSFVQIFRKICHRHSGQGSARHQTNSAVDCTT